MRRMGIGMYGLSLAVVFGISLLLAGQASAGIFTEDFEDGFDGWTLWSNQGIPWTIATPPVAHSGTNVAYSNVLNSYRQQALISPELTAGDSGVQVDYYHVFSLGGSGGDWASLNISVNDGDWQLVKNYPIGGNGFPNNAWLPDYFDSTASYMHETLDLTSLLSPGDAFRLIFYTGADYNYPSSGWAVDDLTVSGVVPEPASLSLLVFGGLLLIGRRRKA